MDLVAVLLGSRCPACRGPGDGLCPGCRSVLRPAEPAPPPAGVDWWVSPFAYAGPLRPLVTAAKYQRAHAPWRWLGVALAEAVAGALRADEAWPDLITWVPASSGQRRQRGFDQAEWLARTVARRLGRPAGALLVRAPGPPQTGRSGPERRAGPGLSTTRPFSGSVLVVDDVATTGATLVAAARVLRRAGAPSVAAATAARTPKPGP